MSHQLSVGTGESAGDRLAAVLAQMQEADERPYAADWLQHALAALPGAIGQLSHQEQQVIIGHLFDERPCENLAANLGLSVPQVESLLQSGMRELRRILAR